MLIINLIVIEIVNIPNKTIKKHMVDSFTAEVNHPFSRQFSRTEALTHQSVL